MLRVAGTDPGSSSLDLLVLEDGHVADQCRFSPQQLQADPATPVNWLLERGPFDLVAGPSGYGLPLVAARDCTERDLALMTLVHPDQRGRHQGVIGFSALLRAFCKSALPVVFLPSVIHLSTVPSYRKINRIDMGTADKLCVGALALCQFARQQSLEYAQAGLCLIELGSAFTACLVIEGGKIVDGIGGTSGPVGWRSSGGWDGEVAYLLSPLEKNDLFCGGVTSCNDIDQGKMFFRESLFKTVGGLQAATPFRDVVLSGRLLERETEFTRALEQDLSRFGQVHRLPSLPGAWVKHAAQGAAVIADGLAGGSYQALVESLALQQAAGSALEWVRHLRADELRQRFESL